MLRAAPNTAVVERVFLSGGVAVWQWWRTYFWPRKNCRVPCDGFM